MARQWFINGVQVYETGEEEYFVEGVQLTEDQASAPPAGGRIMSSLTHHGGLAGVGGIAGDGGGLAG